MEQWQLMSKQKHAGKNTPMHELKQLTTLEELKSAVAVATTATGKACLDGIPVDPPKCVKHIVPFLYSVLCKCWRNGRMRDAEIVTKRRW